jgi:RND family efflux transporter MFP subunit
MKRAYRSLIAAGWIVLIAAGCAGSTPAGGAPTPSAPAVSTVEVAGTVSASAVIEPAQTSQMAFLISAPVKIVNVKAGDPVKAGQPLIVLDTPDLDYAVIAAQAELKSAQTNDILERSTRQYRVWGGRKWIWVHGLPEVRAKADARVLQAQAALDIAEANLAEGTLVAPFDGTAVSVDVVPGEMVVPNKTVLVVGDLSHLQVATTDLSEREIANVQIGQKAATTLKAFSQDLTGRVVAIAPLSKLSDGDTVFKVTIELDQQPKGLLWGMTGDVAIETR